MGNECVGAIVCKLDYHKKVVKRGYIAMLAVDSKYRKLKIGSTLVRKAIETMIAEEADEVNYKKSKIMYLSFYCPKYYQLAARNHANTIYLISFGRWF